MKKFLVYTFGVALMLSVCSCGGSKKSATLNNAGDTLSYGIGVMQGTRLAEAKAMGVYPDLNDLDVDLYIKGVKEGAKTEATSYHMGMNDGIQMKKQFDSMAEQFGIELNFETFLVAYAKAVKGDSSLIIAKDRINILCDSIIAAARVAKEQAELDSIANSPEAKANLEAGIAFLAAKEQEEGVKKTESGLLYKVIKEGNGKQFKITDKIELAYVGKFINDSIFDQNPSLKSVVGRFVPGFTEGLCLMSPGAKYIFYIPSELAYGVRGRGAEMPSNSTLIFEVETKGLAK